MKRTVVIGPLHQVTDIVFAVNGTLVQDIPIEEVFEGVARITGVSFNRLLGDYGIRADSLSSLENQHRSLARKEDRDAVGELYDAHKRSKITPTILPGAIDALKELRKLDKRLICWDRGDVEKRRAVLCSTGLIDFFDVVEVVPNKSVERVKEILVPHMQGRPFAMVGDSYIYDMEPVEGLASARIMVSHSKANRYQPPPKRLGDIVDVWRVEHLLTTEGVAS